MSTIQETLLPAAMVPGMITLEDKKGKRQNFFPIDAKDLIRQGWKLVENGAIEAARMAATPLRSGMASGIPSDQIVAEVSGHEGRVIAASTPEAAEEIISNSDNADAVAARGDEPVAGITAHRESLATSTAGTPGTEGTQGKTPEPLRPAGEGKPLPTAAEAKAAEAKAAEKKDAGNK